MNRYEAVELSSMNGSTSSRKRAPPATMANYIVSRLSPPGVVTDGRIRCSSVIVSSSMDLEGRLASIELCLTRDYF